MDTQSSDVKNTNLANDMDIDSSEEKSRKSCEEEKLKSSSLQDISRCESHSDTQENDIKVFPGCSEEILERLSSETTEAASSNGLQETLDSNTASSSSTSTSLDGFQNADLPSNGESASPLDYDSVGEFCFESDHLALKGNSDYKKLMQVIVILEAKRTKAIKDLEKLIEVQEIALADPIKFVERLQRKEDLGLPGPQSIPALPIIDWNKYTISGGTSLCGRRQNTRLAARANADLNRPSFFELLNKGKTFSSATRRASDENIKPPNFNLSWTAEEQRRLEDLLLQYPPEEVESRRWEKIANALGNRTPTQVASRVQKYFIKLTKAGIPVPGRAPNIAHLRKPRRQVIRHQPSTFLVSQIPPVYMLEDDEDFSSSYAQSLPGSIDENSLDARMDLSDDEEIAPELRDTSEYKEYMMLKKRLQENQSFSALTQHVGYQCNRCGCEPIVGIRWHCTDCASSKPINLCEECAESSHENGRHTADHHLEPVYHAPSTYLDKDYMHFSGPDYNYLDSNYMPAV